MPRRISFDLDDTLICCQPGVPCERGCRLRFLSWFQEPLRQGAPALIRELQERGWEVWILTTSYRSPWQVRLWLRLYGIRVGRVINQRTYEKALRGPARSNVPTKNPNLWDIQLHVDDSEGVLREGLQHGFDVVVVRPDDIQWTDRVRRAAGLIE